MSESSDVYDRNKLVLLTFFLNGVGILVPWNMFINAHAYFTKYKLSESYIGYVFPYTTNFMQILTFCSHIPNISFAWINVFIRLKGSLTKRVIYSVSIEILVFLVTIILAMIDTSSYPNIFFWTTVVCVIILNAASGVYQNTVYGMAGKFPSNYTGAILIGSNLSGTLVSIIDIITNLTTDNYKLAAIYYFLIALFVLVICFDSYYSLPLNRFYRYHELLEKENKNNNENNTIETSSYLEVLKKAKMHYYNVFMVFFVTLSIFPAIQANVKPSDQNFFVPEKEFTGITGFLTFNIFAFLGTLLTEKIKWPTPKYLWIPVTLRLLYIPFYLLSNYQLTGIVRSLDVIFRNDWIYWIVTATMAFSSGYFSVVCLAYANSCVEEKHSTLAGMFGGAFLITGIFAGIIMTFLWPHII